MKVFRYLFSLMLIVFLVFMNAGCNEKEKENEIKTFTLEYKFDNDNNHLLTLFTMDGVYKNACLGVTSSIVSK